MQNVSVAIKAAASRIGVSVEVYIQRVKDGFKWCCGCKDWHKYTAFTLDSSRTDGFNSSCVKHRKAVYKKTYIPKPHVSRKGKWTAPTRDGDAKQARGRVNSLVRVGLLPNPNDVPCVKCNGENNAKRNEWHHHKGYGVDHQEDVVSMCSVCHAYHVRGENHPNAKLTNKQAQKVRGIRATGVEVGEIAKMFSVDKHVIEHIIYNKTYPEEKQ